MGKNSGYRSIGGKLSGQELKDFIKKVVQALDQAVADGEITADDRKILLAEIVRSKLDKEMITI